MNSNLLPCPFCGSTNLRHEFSGSQSYIECNECGTQGPRDEWAADPICDQDAGCAAWNRRAADRAQRQPVPVSERLPGPGDCDAEGRCWWGTPSFVNSYTVTQSAQWRLSAPDDRFGSELFWRPAHALPLPGEVEE